ncbi:MAG: RluA family pseudouridine synthase [Bdellovibrionia bacterium]
MELKIIPEILFEDPNVIVISKPAGLLSQGEHTGDENLVDWLRLYLGRPYVGLVHRLDRNTSGIMVVAKRTKAAQRLTSSLQEGKIVRTYLAWLIGNLSGPARWAHQLRKLEKNNLVKVVTSGGKEAVLSVTPVSKTLWKNTLLTLAEFKLETGRSHQIRVQAAHEGLPLLGDVKYGGTSPIFKNAPSFPRVALHSFHLEFPHPISGEILKFDDPLPNDLNLPLKT